MNKSTEVSATDALIKICELTSPEEVLAFIDGDDRKTVTSAAEKRLGELNGKKEGQTGTITKTAADFKKGVQKTKSYITCEDVLKKQRDEGEEV